MQNEKIATCKSATWNSAIHKKSATRKKCKMKRLLHRKVKHRNGAIWKKCNMKNINCRSEIWKKCTRIVHYSAQTDNEPSVDGSLYTSEDKMRDFSGTYSRLSGKF